VTGLRGAFFICIYSFLRQLVELHP